MMKKLCFLLFIFITAHLATSAQRKVNLKMMYVKYGTSPTNLQQMSHFKRVNYDGKTEYFFAFVLKNVGTDALLNYDTVTVSLNGKRYWDNHLVISPGDTILFTPASNSIVFPVPSGKTLPSSDTAFWCDSVWVATGPGNVALIDYDQSNNIHCQFIDFHYDWPLAVNDIAGGHSELQLFPNPATTSLTIKHDHSGSVGITLRNMLGKEVYNHSRENTPANFSHTVDIGRLPPGLYTAELRYTDQTVVKKFTIQ